MGTPVTKEELDEKMAIFGEQLFNRLIDQFHNNGATTSGGDKDTSTGKISDPLASKIEEARKAQEEYAYIPEDIYGTLIDPRVRTKKELEKYATAAVGIYQSGKYSNIHDAFISDFLYWDKEHFKLVKKEDLTTIHQLLANHGVSIRKDGRYAIWKALGEYIDVLWETDFKGHDSGVENATTCIPEPGEEVDNKHAPVQAMVLPEQLYKEPYSPYRTNNPRPSDISRFFPRELKYSGAPKEPLRRRYKTFMNAVRLSHVDIENTTIMFPLIETLFLTGQALLHFQDTIQG